MVEVRCVLRFKVGVYVLLYYLTSKLIFPHSTILLPTHKTFNFLCKCPVIEDIFPLPFDSNILVYVQYIKFTLFIWFLYSSMNLGENNFVITSHIAFLGSTNLEAPSCLW